MAQERLCYSKYADDYLIYSKNDDTKLVYKGDGGTSLGDVIITITTSPESWTCAEYSTEHEIKKSISSDIGTQSGNVLTIPATPNLSGDFSVYLETYCTSTERPTVYLKIVATQRGAKGLVESYEIVAASNTYTYTVTLDDKGKIKSIN